MAVKFSASLGLSDMDPIGGAVAGAGEARMIHKGFPLINSPSVIRGRSKSIASPYHIVHEANRGIIFFRSLACGGRRGVDEFAAQRGLPRHGSVPPFDARCDRA